MTRMVTLAEACHRLGWTDERAVQRLYQRLRAYERNHDHVIIVATAPGSPVRVAWHHVKLVTMTHQAAVERIAGRDWEHSLEELDTRIADIADRRIDNRVVPELEKLSQETENSANAIEDLRNRIGRLA
jgi:hypothetical protein